MSATTSLNPCPNLQVELNEAFLQNDPSTLRLFSPLFEFITSPANRNGISVQVAPGGSKVRTVEVRYDQLININETSAAVTNPTCTSSTERGDYITNYTIDPAVNNIGITQKFDVVDWQLLCRDGGSLFRKKIQMMIDAVVQSRADKTAVEIAALISSSKWSTDVANAGMTVDVNNNLVINTKTGTTNAAGLSANGVMDIDLSTAITNYNAPYAIFGAELYKYYRAMNVGCCADSGIDMSAALSAYGKATMFDRYQTAHAAGTDGYLTGWIISLGALALIEFSGNEVYSDPNLPAPKTFDPLVVIDPRTGHKLDVNISESCGVYYVQVVSTAKTVGLPADMFPVGHSMRGVTFINKVLVTNT